jgi:hypothetical protein
VGVGAVVNTVTCVGAGVGVGVGVANASLAMVFDAVTQPDVVIKKIKRDRRIAIHINPVKNFQLNSPIIRRLLCEKAINRP